MGEGWHNNHHAYQSSVRQGFRWWELDATYYVLRALSWVGIVWDLKAPPAAVLRNEQRLGSKVIERSASYLVARFDAEKIAIALRSSLPSADLATLCEKIVSAHNGASEALAGIHLPHLPTREEFLNYAKAKLASSPSLEDIADRGYELLLISVGTHLVRSPRLATLQRRSVSE